MDTAFGAALTFTIQLFIIVDPVASVPLFLAITPKNTVEERRRMARRGCVVAFLVVTFFLLAGPPILGYFGIGTPAVRICGGILLFVIALEMLYGHFTRTGTSPAEERLAGEKEDISITPLAIPLLAGPGAITTALIFAGRAEGPAAFVTLFLGCALVFGVTDLFFSRADILLRVLGNLGMTIITRILGLVLAFLAVQYVLDGIQAVFG
jgi:multiple antibiotic resistance protein